MAETEWAEKAVRGRMGSGRWEDRGRVKTSLRWKLGGEKEAKPTSSQEAGV